MDDDESVFSSNIPRAMNSPQNNLYELLLIEPAKPIIIEDDVEYVCDFKPKCGKIYKPKKRNKCKVRTVREVRNEFESDVYAYLPIELEKQQSLLLRKITSGSSREGNTKNLAKNILRSRKPISKYLWQMVTNLNPEENAQSVQYVLWNGKRIRINGGKGGKNTFICNYDLNSKINQTAKKSSSKSSVNKKKGLLRNSLAVNFKPGPLCKKIYLDTSYQKFNVGRTKLVNLPKPALDVQPTFGTVLEPSVTNFLQRSRGEDGAISNQWANFAVSILGSVKNGRIIQNDTNNFVTFNLNYKCKQSKLLMRYDVDRMSMETDNPLTTSFNFQSKEHITVCEIKNIVNDMLDSVEISLQQDSMFSQEKLEENEQDNVSLASSILTKDKNCKRKYCELDRLDVTVIRLPDVVDQVKLLTCQQLHCRMGCICASLQCGYNLKQHCGRSDCMFECKCDFSKYKVTDSFENECPELIPGLLNLDNEINLKLAKEEQKFHQTVVVSGDKSIFLKSERRNWKASKRYADFFSNMRLKTDMKMQPVLAIKCLKLETENIEPWCMVHNLYRCFCKGRFIHNENLEKICKSDVFHETTVPSAIGNTHNSEKKSVKTRSFDKPCTLLDQNSSGEISNSTFMKSVLEDNSVLENTITTARTNPYNGRKYNNLYYAKTHKKILEMETNDKKIQQRMLTLIDNCNRERKEFSRNCQPIAEGREQNKKLHLKAVNRSSRRVPANILDEYSRSKRTEMKIDLESQSDQSNSEKINDINELQQKDETALADLPSMPINPSHSTNAITLTETQHVSENNATTSRVTDRIKLINWLETSYKLYKRRTELGKEKTSLDPPKQGKMALYPWEFILSRYRERKNLFLISKEKPFRIFMAVDQSNSFFNNHMNIDDIRFADLHKYPVTVVNLLTNATGLKDNFCILTGLSHCWELIGAVSKLTEKTSAQESTKATIEEATALNTFQDTDTLPEIDNASSESENSNTKIYEHSDDNDSIRLQELQDATINNAYIATSKWFVMTIENDFTEIQFYERGFFVKYESIIKAINVARLSGKAVRLSSQKCAEQNNAPQFGIYAIPNTNEYCVFVGPYEEEEPLGIETIKSMSHALRVKRTRGIWITTKKVDNLKVIDNPLSFLPSSTCHQNTYVSIENDIDINNKQLLSPDDTELPQKPDDDLPLVKNRQIKPIKIRKTNGFYHFAPNSLLKLAVQPTLQDKAIIKSNAANTVQSSNIYKRNVTTLSPPPLNFISTKSHISRLTKSPFGYETCSNSNVTDNKKPVAEIAPQIKIVGESALSTATQVNDTQSNKKTGMFILKPEEINKRSMEKKVVCCNASGGFSNSTADHAMDEDIENFLATSAECTLPNVLLISDDEADINNSGLALPNSEKDIYIECINVENLGWIRGRRNEENNLSFEFPGFKYTDYYRKEEAFSKINQVLSRKVYVAKNIRLEWQVVESEEQLKSKSQLKVENLGIDIILTKWGLRHKRDLLANKNLFLSRHIEKEETTSGKISVSTASSWTNNESGSFEDVEQASDLLDKLEEQSQLLDDEGDSLLNQISKITSIPSIDSYSGSERERIAQNLQELTKD